MVRYKKSYLNQHSPVWKVITSLLNHEESALILQATFKPSYCQAIKSFKWCMFYNTKMDLKDFKKQLDVAAKNTNMYFKGLLGFFFFLLNWSFQLMNPKIFGKQFFYIYSGYLWLILRSV